jgi:hypothetical protein
MMVFLPYAKIKLGSLLSVECNMCNKLDLMQRISLSSDSHES